MSAGVVAAWMVICVIMPSLNMLHMHPMFANENTVVYRYGWLHANAQSLQVFLDLFFRLSATNFPGAHYLFMLLACAGLLPLIAPWFLLAGSADLLANLLSLNHLPRLYLSYHSAPLVPVLTVAAMAGWHGCRIPALRRLLTAAALFCCMGLLPDSGFTYWELKRPVLALPGADKIALQRMAQEIGTCGSPRVQADIAAFLPLPAQTRSVSQEADAADCLFLHLAYPYARLDKNLISSPYAFYRPEVYINMILPGLLRDPRWHIAYWQDPWLVLKHTAGTEDKVARDMVRQALADLRKAHTGNTIAAARY
jgi:hypothetical protein